MSSSDTSYLSVGFLTAQGVEVTKPLRDWLTRAAYLAKNRGGVQEQQRYIYWALSLIEGAAAQPGGVASVDWRQMSPVMPPGAPHQVPAIVQNSRNAPPSSAVRYPAPTADGNLRAQLWDETLRRAPSDLHAYVSQAFTLYDRDVAIGKRSYRQVSSLEMLNLANSLLALELKKKHPVPTAAVTTHVVSPAPQKAVASVHTALPESAAPSRLKRSREEAKPHPAAEAATAKRVLATENGDSDFFVCLGKGGIRGDTATSGSSGNAGKQFIGRSCELERDYSRYEPTVDDIRPQRVLEEAFRYIQARAEEKSEVDGKPAALKYLNEQLKGMRQDIRVQNISNGFAVSVYEFHARLCLEIGDLGEFNQCQSALKRLYTSPDVESKETCSVSEFFCYRLAYLSLSQQYDALSTELINYTNELPGNGSMTGTAQCIDRDDVRRVLRMCAACDEGDCFALARDVQRLPAPMSCLVGIYLQRLRVRWLLEILSGVRGGISLRFIMANLGFTPQVRQVSDDSAARTNLHGADRHFWLDGSMAKAESAFEDFCQTLKLMLPDSFSFAKELARDSARDHTGASRNDAGTVPSLEATATRAIVEQYVAYLHTRKDAAPSSP